MLHHRRSLLTLSERLRDGAEVFTSNTLPLQTQVRQWCTAHSMAAWMHSDDGGSGAVDAGGDDGDVIV